MFRKLNVIIMVLGSFATITSAQADGPVCETVTECQSQLTQAEARFALLALGPIVRESDVYRGSDSSVLIMGRREAEDYCSTRGGLPTLKQLALALNPDGVSEIAREGFTGVAPRGGPSFYYNASTFVLPMNYEEGNLFFWSSNPHATNGNGSTWGFEIYNGRGGVAASYFRDAGAVRCMNGNNTVNTDGPVCETAVECQSLIIQLKTKLAELSPLITLGPIARNADGSVKRMRYSEAVEYCATQGGLPNIKQLSLALHPEGVSETASEGFRRVVPTRGEAAFFYNSTLYVRPLGDEGATHLWSSSLPYGPTSSPVWYFNAYLGYPDDRGVSHYSDTLDSDTLAVRCLSDH